MDTIFIKELTASAVLGVYEWERHIRQRVVVDLALSTDANHAALHDQLTDALDYGKLAIRVTEAIEQSDFQLIESLAEHLSQLIFNEFGVAKLTLTLTKPGAVPNAKAVGVCIERIFPPVIASPSEG